MKKRVERRWKLYKQMPAGPEREKYVQILRDE
jgi:hypothetical protein